MSIHQPASVGNYPSEIDRQKFTERLSFHFAGRVYSLDVIWESGGLLPSKIKVSIPGSSITSSIASLKTRELEINWESGWGVVRVDLGVPGKVDICIGTRNTPAGGVSEVRVTPVSESLNVEDLLTDYRAVIEVWSFRLSLQCLPARVYFICISCLQVWSDADAIHFAFI